MNIQSSSPAPLEVSTETTAYEAPAIESVVTLEEVEREVHYAGITTSGAFG